MAVSTRSQSRTHPLAVGFVAGIIAAILIELFLLAANHANPIQVWQWIASGLVGSVPFTATIYAWLGLGLHFVISILFSIIYAYAATSIETLTRRPVLSGIIYGFVVIIAMHVPIVLTHMAPAPADAKTVIVSLIGHTVFFGLPLALYVSSRLRPKLR
ncbi:MAG: hypothetical protein M3Z37_02680 [Candidatus Eremiobacteraeota bacterium]|nr:hypothetical protein [Candidatus Eremiobacteraeota bacterium]